MAKIGAIALAILSLNALSANPGHEADRKSGEATKQPEVQVVGLEAPAAISLAEYIAVQDYLDITNYLNIMYYFNLLEEAKAWAAAHPPVRVATSNPVRQGSSPHTDAWWRGVAQCEQSGNNHPYFGYFSWMDGSAAGLTWDQQVAKSNALLATVSSESPAWAPSCVAMGYQYSPGG